MIVHGHGKSPTRNPMLIPRPARLGRDWTTTSYIAGAPRKSYERRPPAQSEETCIPRHTRHWYCHTGASSSRNFISAGLRAMTSIQHAPTGGTVTHGKLAVGCGIDCFQKSQRQCQGGRFTDQRVGPFDGFPFKHGIIAGLQPTFQSLTLPAGAVGLRVIQ